jgi:hypothetical protein
MKTRQLIKIFLFVILFIVVITGCEYKGPTALYYQKHNPTSTPVIDRLEPDLIAPAGYNYITILGENFAEKNMYNWVYFSYIDEDDKAVVVDGEIVESSTTSIKVRRPNLVHDSITVKVATEDALLFDEYGPYQIDPVNEDFGGFFEALNLSAIAEDNLGNVYVFQQYSPFNVYQITSDGTRTVVEQMTGSVYDARIHPDGKWILIMNNSTVYQREIVGGDTVVSEFANVGKSVRFGDFDSNGNLYTGGISRSDLYIVPSGESEGVASGYYADKFYCIRVSMDKGTEYVYSLVELRNPDENNPEIAIWRNEILDASGNLGERELVLDWSTTDTFADYAANTFVVREDEDGTIIYVGTDSEEDPILIYDPDKNNQDILYKDILPSPATILEWGSSRYMYMIMGDQWTVQRIDMGTNN